MVGIALAACLGATACSSTTRHPAMVGTPVATESAPEPPLDEASVDEPVELTPTTVEPPASVQSEAVPRTTWAIKEPVVSHARTRAIVLMYHSIDQGTHARSVSPKMFENHLTWLNENHVEVVPLSTFLSFLDGKIELPERVAVITIDDGERSFYRNAYPLLVKHGMPFALGLPTSAIEQSNERPTFTWPMVREMMATGLCEVASHSHTHPNLARIGAPGVRHELTISRDLIEKNTGVRPVSFFYPMGSFNREVLDITAELYGAGFVAVGSPVKPATPRFRIPRYEMSNTVGVVRLASFARRAGLDVPDPSVSRRLLATR